MRCWRRPIRGQDRGGTASAPPLPSDSRPRTRGHGGGPIGLPFRYGIDELRPVAGGWLAAGGATNLGEALSVLLLVDPDGEPGSHVKLRGDDPAVATYGGETWVVDVLDGDPRVTRIGCVMPQ